MPAQQPPCVCNCLMVLLLLSRDTSRLCLLCGCADCGIATVRFCSLCRSLQLLSDLCTCPPQIKPATVCLTVGCRMQQLHQHAPAQLHWPWPVEMDLCTGTASCPASRLPATAMQGALIINNVDIVRVSVNTAAAPHQHTHLKQLLGVLAEAICFAQVQGSEVSVEGLIQLQRSRA